MSRTSLIILLCLTVLAPQFSFALKETTIGQLGVSASLSGTYDSRVFGISSSAYQASRNSSSSLIASEEIKSEDDFIISFSPALHLTKKLRWISVSGSAGVQISQYLKNDDKSYVIPVTTLTVDFDESLKKRISNNAKIRFSATFDLGQHVDTSVLEQDLVSYSYLSLGLDVRYNHSPKFGVSAGTSYTHRNYQTGSVSERPYQDLTTLPLQASAFYIYSEKLDFFTQYGFSRTKGSGSSAPSLTDSDSHSISFGANGDLSPKLSGNAQVGYTVLNFENPTSPNQDNLTMGVALNWKFNEKTSFNFDVDRSFSPSAQGFSMFSTMSRIGATHRFTQDLSGNAYFSYGVVDYTYANIPSIPSRDSSSLDQFGMGFSVQRALSQHFTTSGGYDYSYSNRDIDSFGRHLLMAQITGSF
jgi:hypothetical protein